MIILHGGMGNDILHGSMGNDYLSMEIKVMINSLVVMEMIPLLIIMEIIHSLAVKAMIYYFRYQKAGQNELQGGERNDIFYCGLGTNLLYNEQRK